MGAAPRYGEPALIASNVFVVFFCEKEEPKFELRKAMDTEHDQRLNVCAHNLYDGHLLARLEKVRVTQNIESDTSLKLSVHHASINRGLAFEVSSVALLPLLREQAHSVATVCHVMDKIKKTVAYLNLDQIPAITADQPIYAVLKQV